MGRGKGRSREWVRGWGTRMCLRRMCNSFSFSFHAINYLGFPSVYYFYRSFKGDRRSFYLSFICEPLSPTPYPIPHRIASHCHRPMATENRVGSAETKHELLHNQRKTFSLLASTLLAGLEKLQQVRGRDFDFHSRQSSSGQRRNQE